MDFHASGKLVACLSDVDLAAMLAGQSTTEEKELHLDTCSDCQRRLEAIDEQAELPKPNDAAWEIDGFRLEEVIGRGGMGVVYRAHDEELDRPVAVKILQERFAVKSPAATRFLDEARIAGQLQHPGIPAVYRFSALADGRPFLAMKLIQGTTLKELLQSGQSLNRLAVIEAVAQAVGYAHAEGVIHRDLKAENIMIGSFGEVQVMDWGLAKVLGATPPPLAPSAPSAETTIRTLRDSDGAFTQAGSVLGTPAYMAPEQAAGKSARTDTRSDVFGLGAVLCMLLTGKPPFDGTDAEPVRLNAERGNTEAAFARLDASDAEPALVALCKRCLAFEPNDRPNDGNALAEEIAGLRVAAEDRARRAELEQAKAEVFASEQTKRRKHLTFFAAALAASLIGIALGLSRARTAEGEANTNFAAAERARAKAQENLEKSERSEEAARKERDVALAVKNFLQFDLLQLADAYAQAGAQLSVDPEVKVRDLVQRAAKSIEGRFAGQPHVESELRTTLARTLLAVGASAAAATQAERALRLRERQLPSNEALALESMEVLAFAEYSASHPMNALRWCEELEKRYAAIGKHDAPEDLRARQTRADCLAALTRHKEAAKVSAETLTVRRRVLGEDDPHTLASKNSLAHSYARIGRGEEALRLRQEALVALRRTLGENHPATSLTLSQLAWTFAELGRSKEALPLMQQALALGQSQLGATHPQTLLRAYGVASFHHESGRHEQAAALAQETLATQTTVLGRGHDQTVKTLDLLGRSKAKLGALDDAKALMEEASALRAKAAAPDPSDFNALHELAEQTMKAGQIEKALKLWQARAEGLRDRMGAAHPETQSAYHELANRYRDAGRREEAVNCTRVSLTAMEKQVSKFPNDLEATAACCWLAQELAERLHAIGRLPEADPLLELATTRLESLLARSPKNAKWHECRGHVEAWRSGVATLAGRRDDVVARRTNALEAFESAAALDPNNPDLLRLCCDQANYIAATRLKQKQWAEVEPAFAEAIKRRERWAAVNPAIRATLPQWKLHVRLLTANAKCQSGDRAVAEARLAELRNELRELAETSDSSRNAQRYDAACVWSLAAGLREGKAREEATASALALLAKLRDLSFFKKAAVLANFRSDEDFAPLRSREDFRAFARSLESPSAAKSVSPAPARQKQPTP